tara:strand:- start:46 stop:264 length:219 start_codon:yes stop_codon:yes gene_type:complete
LQCEQPAKSREKANDLLSKNFSALMMRADGNHFQNKSVHCQQRLAERMSKAYLLGVGAAAPSGVEVRIAARS